MDLEMVQESRCYLRHGHRKDCEKVPERFLPRQDVRGRRHDVFPSLHEQRRQLNLSVFQKALDYREKQGKADTIRIAKWCIGRTLRSLNRIDEALTFFKKNVENFPNSSNVYDSLGEAYEKNGQFKQAAQNYEKAYKLAESRGETQLVQTYKANLERVGQKIK